MPSFSLKSQLSNCIFFSLIQGLTKIQAKQRLIDEGRNHIEPPHVSVSKSCERFWLQPYILFVAILSLLAILCFVAFAIQLNTRQEPTYENVTELNTNS